MNTGMFLRKTNGMLKICSVLAVGVLFLAVGAPEAFAQYSANGMIANQEAMNNLGGSAPSSAYPMSQARAVAQGADPYGNPGADPYGADPYGGSYIDPSVPVWTRPTPAVYPAKQGRRVYDALVFRLKPNSPLLLDDIYEGDITEDERVDYVKEGSFYTNIEPDTNSEYIGGETFASLRRNIAALRATHQMNPLQFFGLKAMSLDRSVSLPTLREKTTERNEKIHKRDLDGKDYSGWSKTFLREYRVDPDDPERASEFFALYVPQPPHAPALPLPPAGWRPPVYKKSALQAAVDAFLNQTSLAPDMLETGYDQLTGEPMLPDPSVNPEDARQAARRDAEKAVWQQLKDDTYRTQFLTQYGQKVPGQGGGGYPGGEGYPGGGGGYPGGGGGGGRGGGGGGRGGPQS